MKDRGIMMLSKHDITSHMNNKTIQRYLTYITLLWRKTHPGPTSTKIMELVQYNRLTGTLYNYNKKITFCPHKIIDLSFVCNLVLMKELQKIEQSCNWKSRRHIQHVNNPFSPTHPR